MIQPENSLDKENLLDGVIEIENTEIMNKKLEFSFMFFTVPSGLLVVLLNMKVLGMLWKKEKTMVNQMMSIDCCVNIMFACLSTFQQSPYFRGLDFELYCAFHLVIHYVGMIFNRLCPLAIVFYR